MEEQTEQVAQEYKPWELLQEEDVVITKLVQEMEIESVYITEIEKVRLLFQFRLNAVENSIWEINNKVTKLGKVRMDVIAIHAIFNAGVRLAAMKADLRVIPAQPTSLSPDEAVQWTRKLLGTLEFQQRNGLKYEWSETVNTERLTLQDLSWWKKLTRKIRLLI